MPSPSSEPASSQPKPISTRFALFSALGVIVCAFAWYGLEQTTDIRLRSKWNRIASNVGGALAEHRMKEEPIPVWVPLSVLVLTPIFTPLLVKSSRHFAENSKPVIATVRKAYSLSGARVVTLEYELDGKLCSKTVDIREPWGARLSSGDKLEARAVGGWIMGRIKVTAPLKSGHDLMAMMSPHAANHSVRG